jgi:hypothetical protein
MSCWQYFAVGVFVRGDFDSVGGLMWLGWATFPWIDWRFSRFFWKSQKTGQVS